MLIVLRETIQFGTLSSSSKPRFYLKGIIIQDEPFSTKRFVILSSLPCNPKHSSLLLLENPIAPSRAHWLILFFLGASSLASLRDILTQLGPSYHNMRQQYKPANRKNICLQILGKGKGRECQGGIAYYKI